MKSEWIWAALTGCLLFCAYTCPVGVVCTYFAILLLCFRVGNLRFTWQRVLYLFVMYLVWASLQMFFLIEKTRTEGLILFLIPLLIAVLLTLFASPALIVGNVRPVESSLCGLLMSDFVFSIIPVGNDFFSIGLPLVYFPVAVQFVKFLGPHFLSFWTLFSCLLLYRFLVFRMTRTLVSLFLFFFLPITISLVIWYANNSSHTDVPERKQVAVMGLSDHDPNTFASSLLSNVVLGEIDYLLLPEGYIFAKQSEAAFIPESTFLRRLSKRDSLTIIYGVMTYQDDIYSNAVKMLCSDNHDYKRNKSHLIPFAEYLPLPFFLGRFPSIVERMPYRLSIDKNSEQIWTLPDGHHIAALICYESLSPSFVSKIVNDGAEAIFVSSSCTWVNSVQFEQVCFLLLRLSAITTNRFIIRSACGGLSMFVDEKGQVCDISENKSELLMDSISLISKPTFYVKYAEHIELMYAVISGMMLILFFWDKKIG